MANWFTRSVERVTNVVGRLVGREPDVSRVPTGPLPGAERRGLGERIRDVFQPSRADRERLEQELAESRDRERQATDARELAEREAREAREMAQRERVAREAAEREIKEKTEPRQAVKPQPPAPPVTPPASKPEPQLPPDLRTIPPVMPLGPKGRDGAAYTTAAADDVMSRLHDAAILGQRVSLRVHDETGWHDLFLNEKSGPGRHKPARGISADYLAQFIGDDLGDWISEGCDLGEGETSDYDAVGEVDGYQLTVWG
jgi:hypothetical protein